MMSTEGLDKLVRVVEHTEIKSTEQQVREMVFALCDEYCISDPCDHDSLVTRMIADVLQMGRCSKSPMCWRTKHVGDCFVN